TRCYYFYDTGTPCNKREPGSGCPARSGLNRIHAILGASEACVATHPSDMCVALAALKAVVHVQGPAAKRQIPFGEFHRLPGDTPQQDNHLAPDELITAIELPDQGFAEHFRYVKVRDRASYAFALVSVAAALRIENGVIQEARIALGGVAHKPWRNEAVEAILQGQAPSTELFTQAATALLQGAQPLSQNGFKVQLAQQAIVRALTEAAAGGSLEGDAQ
ncbi:MAG TPA: FAD-binding molybdopterin dehydrogenase, partial [Pseudomonas sp.]|nr:FAD-binding molybdopterin dehydrogenase [Pseudomonas sp.]